MKLSDDDMKFFDLMMDERLKNILMKAPIKDGDQIIKEAEDVIDSLDEDKHNKLDAYLDMMTDDMAERERKAYVGGLKDGILVMKTLFNLRN